MTRSSHAARLALPAAAALVALAVAGSGVRALLVLALPLACFAAVAQRLPRVVHASTALVAGVIALGAGVISHSPPAVAAGVLLTVRGAMAAWGLNRGRGRARAWTNRGVVVLAAALVAFFVVLPALVATAFLAKPRSPIDDAALGIAHESVRFDASDGVRLSGWYVPSRNGAAVVLVHGGGGDRQGTILHARMLAHAGYGVLLYDARGRGTSAGHENAAGWEWDRDVRGAVSYLTAHHIRRIGLLGLSTGAEAVVTEAAGDARVRAVVADGLQGRTTSDARRLDAGDRVSVEPSFAVIGAVIRLVRGEHAPPPLIRVVHEVARTRPLLLIGTESFERAWDRAYVRGTTAKLWELPASAHTRGLADHPDAYAHRVLALLGSALHPAEPRE